MRPLHRQLRPLQLEVQIRWRHSIQVGGNRDEQNYAESVAFSVTGDIRNLSQARHIKENDVQNQIVESERAWKTLQPMLSSTLQERHEGEVNPPKGSILVKLHLEGSDDGRAAQRELSLRELLLGLLKRCRPNGRSGIQPFTTCKQENNTIN